MRRIGRGLARGRADGRVHRILPAVRVGQRGQRQDVRFVAAGHGANRRYLQRIQRQRAGLVGAQDIHRGRFIHRGEAVGNTPRFAKARELLPDDVEHPDRPFGHHRFGFGDKRSAIVLVRHSARGFDRHDVPWQTVDELERCRPPPTLASA